MEIGQQLHKKLITFQRNEITDSFLIGFVMRQFLGVDL
jgi:hypothetical protein